MNKNSAAWCLAVVMVILATTYILHTPVAQHRLTPLSRYTINKVVASEIKSTASDIRSLTTRLAVIEGKILREEMRDFHDNAARNPIKAEDIRPRKTYDTIKWDAIHRQEWQAYHRRNR